MTSSIIKQKNVTINDYHVLGRAKRREVASKIRYKIKKVNKLITTIEGEIYKNTINTYLTMGVPMLWRKYFKYNANHRDFIYSFCYNPYKKIHRYCCEWYLNNSFKNTTVMAIDYDVPNNYIQVHIFDILQKVV